MAKLSLDDRLNQIEDKISEKPYYSEDDGRCVVIAHKHMGLGYLIRRLP